MKLKTKQLIIFTVILVGCCLTSISWAKERDQKKDIQRRCQQECDRQQPYFEEHLCRRKCEETEESDHHHDHDHDDHINVIRYDDDDHHDHHAKEEYERCQQRCPGTGKQQWECQQMCKDEYEHAEPHHQHQHQHDPHAGDKRYPQRHDYTHCLRECEDREEGFPRQRQCKLRCEEEFGERRERHDHQHRDDKRGHRKGLSNIINKSKDKKKDNPYYFDSESFESIYSTQEGKMSVLQRFSEKSKLLLGIDRFRIGRYEANPKTFMLPHHVDADSIIYIMKGNAVITLLMQENRKTFNLERGDVLMIPAGTTTYLTNSHDDEKLEIAELLRPVNNLGHLEEFFGIGGAGPKSVFNSFSPELLQAALNIPKEQLKKMFSQQREGAIIRASKEQVRSLAMSGRQFGESRDGPFKLLYESLYSNEHGDFYEVTPNDYQPLQDLDVSVGYCNIKQGSMMAPHYNSRTTYVVLVEEGSGYIEMVSPQLESESNKKHSTSSKKYEKVRSRLSKGDVFVIPAGYSIILVASEEEFRTIGFGINAQNNQRNFLAGQENIINQLDEEAMELSFNMPAREVEEMFQQQGQSYFMAAPQESEKEDLVSILDFAGF